MIPLEIKDWTCDECAKEIGLSNILDEHMISKDSRWQHTKTFPADDPIWVIYKEFLSRYMRQCLVFTYDDMVYALCKKHLRSYFDSME